MDSGKTTETKIETKQPAKAVVADVEDTKDKPLSEDTEQVEVYVDEEEGDQEKPNSMSQSQSYAAFIKERDKRKRKNAELEEEKQRSERLEREIAELKSTVSQIAKGARPELHDFDTTDEFIEALEKWKGTGATKQTENKKQAERPDTSEADFYLFEKERELTKQLPDYDQSKSKVMEKLKKDYDVKDPELTISMLSNIAKQGGIDIAKAIFAMEKYPSIIDELNATGSKDGVNQIAMSKVLEKAAARVKTRSVKNIDAQPEPEITNSGQVNSVTKEIKRAMDAYAETGSIKDFRALQEARKKGKKS